MNGVNVIGDLLRASADITAVVPAERIRAGALPQQTAIPAIVVESISLNDRNILQPGDTRMVRERVQVTVLAPNYRQKNDILRLVRKVCADRRANLSSQSDVVVLTDGAGPDFMADDASFWMQNQDFSVSYNESTV